MVSCDIKSNTCTVNTARKRYLSESCVACGNKQYGVSSSGFNSESSMSYNYNSCTDCRTLGDPTTLLNSTQDRLGCVCTESHTHWYVPESAINADPPALAPSPSPEVAPPPTVRRRLAEGIMTDAVGTGACICDSGYYSTEFLSIESPTESCMKCPDHSSSSW